MTTPSVISKVIVNKGQSRPTCLQFQNGELPEGKEASLSCGVYTNDARRIVPVLASDKLIYTGQVKGQNAYNTFIAIKSHRTNKIKLVAVNEAMLQPKPPKIREILDSTMMETNKRALTDLNKEFGSKKTKRQTETLERLKINVDNFKDQLEKTVANVSLEEMNVEQPNQTSDILPYINKDAENVADVYTLNKLIPPGILQSLEEASTNLLEASSDELVKITDESIKSQILEQQKLKDQKAQKHVAILLVMDAIINIRSTQLKNISNRSYKASLFSQALCEFVMNTFTVKGNKTRSRPVAMKDKACCYIVVLNLLLNQNKVDLSATATQLNLSLKKLTELCHMLLLHVTGKNASVKLPLPAPRVFISKGKGKGRR